jgi:hypothetical protein
MPDGNEKRTPLMEGVDYYVERGLFVFTAAYHLKRGHCCDSGCRHCPYRGNQSSGEPAASADGDERE